MSVKATTRTVRKKTAATTEAEPHTMQSSHKTAGPGVPLFLQRAPLSPDDNVLEQEEGELPEETSTLQPMQEFSAIREQADKTVTAKTELPDEEGTPESLDKGLVQRRYEEENDRLGGAVAIEEEEVQPKLTINAPHDEYEQEADQVAEKMMRTYTDGLAQPFEYKEEEHGPPAADVQASSLTPSYLQVSKIAGKGISRAKSITDESASLASVVNNPSGGAPLPGYLRSRLEPVLGTDLAKVRVHSDNRADKAANTIKARAFTHKNNIYLAKDQSVHDLRLMSHELTHTAQQSRGEQREVIQRGTPAAHAEIESKARGVKEYKYKPPWKKIFGIRIPVVRKPPSEEQIEHAQINIGNWMRDYSQVFSPSVLPMVAENVPVNVNRPQGQKIGMEGAMALLVGILRALAVLEFGKAVADPVVNAENLGVYKPEGHMDNPMGIKAEEFLVTPLEAPVPKTRVALGADDPGYMISHSGSGVAGTQAENPELYKASQSGLSGHIYNTIEKTKHRLFKAVELGATAQGRMEYGAASHAIQDYFSHSNFIEVALNLEIERAHEALAAKETPGLSNMFLNQLPDKPAGGYWVDPLYAKTVGRGINERNVITTGTFGPLDVEVSLAHMLLPKLPELEQRVNQGLDRILYLVSKTSGSTVERIRAHSLDDREIGAFFELIDGMSLAGMTSPSLYIETSKSSVTRPYWGIPPVKTFDIEVPTGFKWKDKQDIRVSVEESLRSIAKIKKSASDIDKAIPFLGLGAKIERMLLDATEGFRKRIKNNMSNFIGMLRKRLEKLNAKEIAKATSLESRLRNSKDPLAKLQASPSFEDQAKFQRMMPARDEPLPPSHSEIGKDNPPGNKHEGSKFYGMHHILAIRAQKHMDILMARAWGVSSLIGTKWKSQLDSAEVEQKNKAVSAAAERERIRTPDEKAGIPRTQLQTSIPLIYKQDVWDLLDSVDFYISHPRDTTWWRPLVRAYIDKHPREVAEHIRLRNLTRGQRK